MTELGPYDVLVKVAEALDNGTDLTPLDQLLGDKSTPSPLLHRSFRIDPARGTPFGKAQPGDVVMERMDLAVVLTHDYLANAHLASYQVASQDLVAAIRALLTRTELSGLGQPLLQTWSVRRSGHQIETTIALQVQHHITLPEAAP